MKITTIKGKLHRICSNCRTPNDARFLKCRKCGCCLICGNEVADVENVKIEIDNINSFFHRAYTQARIRFENGNKESGNFHKVFINDGRGSSEKELLRSTSYQSIMNMLIGFDKGIRQFIIFRQQ